jgi:hypothetical protein
MPANTYKKGVKENPSENTLLGEFVVVPSLSWQKL